MDLTKDRGQWRSLIRTHRQEMTGGGELGTDDDHDDHDDDDILIDANIAYVYLETKSFQLVLLALCDFIRREIGCYMCLLIEQRHANVLQYKESKSVLNKSFAIESIRRL